jgi:soluble calcium-activated nucleotidase 1
VRAQLSEIPAEMEIAIITDLDHASKTISKLSNRWSSIYKRGKLRYDKASDSFSVVWDSDVLLSSAHSEADRGMELSELVLYNGALYTMDDRSGIVYEVVDYKGNPRVFPRYILMEGDGNTDKGFKCEWAAVKDGEMIVGSFGREYTLDDGTIKNYNNNWVKIISPDGRYVCVSVCVGG